MNEFIDSLLMLSAQSGLPMNKGCAEKMAAFYELLEEANRSFNLTSIEGPADSALRHFIDSLALPALNRIYSGESIVDIGTGAGFPGVPIAILRENIRVTLLDSTRKRTLFLESAVKTLGLGNVSVVTARAEDFARGANREKFDAALSRAVAPLNVLLEYMLPMVKPGGRSLAWKGPSAADEAAVSANASRILGGGKPVLHSYTLPGRSPFFIVETEKTSRTPLSFPRKSGKPTSNPLV